MLLSAHRVSSPTRGVSGINAFRYNHGDIPIDWTQPDPQLIAEANPGILVADDIEVAPGGNLVRSYLDVVAHDSTSGDGIERALAAFRPAIPASNPSVLRGGIAARFGVELGLEEEGRLEEFDALSKRLLSLLSGARASNWRGIEPLTVEFRAEGDQTKLRLAPQSVERLKSTYPQWSPVPIRIREEVRDDLAFIHGNILRELVRALLPPAFTEEELLRFGGVRVVDVNGGLVTEWPVRTSGGTGYCLKCQHHNTLFFTAAGYRCRFCGNLQENNGLWVASLT